MEWVETTGRSVEDALDAALDELGVDESDVEYEILEEAKGGLFGRIGGSPARVRARVRPVSREKPGERQRRNRRQGSRSRGGTSRRPSGADAAGSVRPTTLATDDEVPDDVDSMNGTSDASPGRSAAGPGGASGSGRNRRRRGGRGRSVTGRASGSEQGGGSNAGESTGNGETDKARRGRPTAGSDERTTMESSTDLSIEEQAAIADEFTTGLIDAFDLGAEVAVTVEDDSIQVSIDGSTIGLLVGPKGATLTAIEELVRTVVQRQTDGHGARINIDVGGYRAKRREALEAFTRELATQVLESGRPQALEPMSPLDRKVVHDAAAEIAGIATESEGEEPRRRVVLRPA
jgi:spoIIIJ-associated protein